MRSLSAFFRAAVTLESFVGCWLALEPGDRWRLGSRVRLGRTASLGGKVWSRSSKFRLRLGPLSLDEFRRMLPGGTSLARLEAIVRNYVGDALDWDLNLVLKRDEVPVGGSGAGRGSGTHYAGSVDAIAGPMPTTFS